MGSRDSSGSRELPVASRQSPVTSREFGGTIVASCQSQKLSLEILCSTVTSMSTTPVIIDGLWHALCPRIGSRTALRLLQSDSRRPLRLNRAPLTARCASTTSARATRSTPAAKTLDHPTSLLSNYAQILDDDADEDSSSSSQPRKRENETTKYMPATSILDGDLDNVRATAYCGHHNAVLDWAEYSKRFDPSKISKARYTQAYRALILANVSAKEGSARHVHHWLNEMKMHGLELDSGVCHDALKVGPLSMLVDT